MCVCVLIVIIDRTDQIIVNFPPNKYFNKSNEYPSKNGYNLFSQYSRKSDQPLLWAQ